MSHGVVVGLLAGARVLPCAALRRAGRTAARSWPASASLGFSVHAGGGSAATTTTSHALQVRVIYLYQGTALVGLVRPGFGCSPDLKAGWPCCHPWLSSPTTSVIYDLQSPPPPTSLPQLPILIGDCNSSIWFTDYVLLPASLLFKWFHLYSLAVQ